MYPYCIIVQIQKVGNTHINTLEAFSAPEMEWTSALIKCLCVFIAHWCIFSFYCLNRRLKICIEKYQDNWAAHPRWVQKVFFISCDISIINGDLQLCISHYSVISLIS